MRICALPKSSLTPPPRARSGDGGSVFILTREVSVTSPSEIIEPTATPSGYI